MILLEHVAASRSSADSRSPVPLVPSDLTELEVEKRCIDEDGRSRTQPRPVIVAKDPTRRCTALEVLLHLNKMRRLPFFQEIHGLPSPDGLGDCHDITMFFMADLVRGGHAFGWLWVSGVGMFGGSREPYLHCWLEFDGWVFDPANGKLHFWEREAWYRTTNPKNVTRRTARQWKRDLFRRSPKRHAQGAQLARACGTSEIKS